MVKKKINEEYKKNFLKRISKLDREELQKILHSNSKPIKKLRIAYIREDVDE